MPITRNFRELRDELQRLTISPDDAGLDWLETQIELIEALKTRHPHGIALHTAWNADLTDVNCYMFALGLLPNEIGDWRDVGIQPDTKTGFIGRLLESKILTSCASGAMPQDGLVFYFTAEGRPMHAGRSSENFPPTRSTSVRSLKFLRHQTDKGHCTASTLATIGFAIREPIYGGDF